jgi:hypothetical protein
VRERRERREQQHKTVDVWCCAWNAPGEIKRKRFFRIPLAIIV